MTNLSLVPKSSARHQREFLPAALEVVETPARPAGRAVLWLIVAFFTTAVVWACVSEVDVVAVARGKVIPAGRVKVIQPLEMGVVSAIHVSEGERVAAGQLLVSLDPTEAEADLTRVEAEQHAALGAMARVDALLEWSAADSAPESVTSSPTFATATPAAVVTTQRRLYNEQRDEQLAIRAQLDASVKRATAEQEAVAERIAMLKATLPLVNERAAALRKLAKNRLAARNDYLLVEQERIERKQQLASLRKEHDQLSHAIAQANAERDRANTQFVSNLLREQAELGPNLERLTQQHTSATQRASQRELTAPTDGVVQQIAVHTVGGVVTPAQELMKVVPTGDEIRIEAIFENKDIGHVRAGQPVEVKFDAFPFTKFGTAVGQLEMVAGDAVERPNVGWVFPSVVRIEGAPGGDEYDALSVGPGMAATVEATIGHRRIIEFLLAPIMKGFGEAGRER